MATGSEAEEDHYANLGLPSGEEGAKLSIKEIEKAYKIKARECHPDKRRDDPTATAVFQKLVSSFEILKDDAARKAFDGLLRARKERLLRESRHDSKRRKLTSDLEQRERAAADGFGLDRVEKARREEAAAARLKEELARFRAAMLAKKSENREKSEVKGGEGTGLDKERVLKVSWERSAGEYSDEGLREVFGGFGGVEDVMLRRGTKRKGSALVVMASKDAAVSAVHSMVGNVSNPLLVLPLHSPASEEPPARQPEGDSAKLDKLVGRGYQDFEDSVLKKLQKAAEKQR